MSNRQSTHRSPNQWQTHLEQQAESGLSIKAYCQQHGLAPSNFYAWRKKLAPAAQNSPQTGSPWVALPSTASSNSGINTQALVTSTEIFLSLPNGIQLSYKIRSS